MKFSTSLAFLLSLAMPLLQAQAGPASHNGRAANHRRHSNVNASSRELAKRADGSVNLFKRFDNARFTFFADGLGACGKTSQPSDFIVALNSAQYDGGSHCFETITITANGKTAQATIMDECPGCPFGGLDFSTGLFDHFADPSVGVLTGAWNFGGSSDPAPSTTHTTTHTTPHTTSMHSSTHTTPTTTHTSTPTTTSHSSTSTSSSSTSTSSSSSVTPTSTDSGAAEPTSASDPQTLQQLNLAMVGLGSLFSGGGASAADV